MTFLVSKSRLNNEDVDIIWIDSQESECKPMSVSDQEKAINNEPQLLKPKMEMIKEDSECSSSSEKDCEHSDFLKLKYFDDQQEVVKRRNFKFELWQDLDINKVYSNLRKSGKRRKEDKAVDYLDCIAEQERFVSAYLGDNV